MNVIPQNYIRVEPKVLSNFVVVLAQKAGMSEPNARFLAEQLVNNDLRGVFSHGTQQIATYARIMRDGFINPNPKVRIVNETSATLVVDGDGGLGYFPANKAALELVARCRANGIAVGVSRNHGHIGAAGIYARLLAEHGLIAYVTSGHQLTLDSSDSIMRAAGGSPMSFAVPAGKSPAMVLDFGTMHDLYADSPHVDEIYNLAPGLVFRSMGLGFVCQALGGFLAGVPVDEQRSHRRYKGANQGALIIAIDITQFTSLEDFHREMDEFVERTSQMQPLPGHDRATLPGILEWEREQDWREMGIPVDYSHRNILRGVADEFGVELPF